MKLGAKGQKRLRRAEEYIGGVGRSSNVNGRGFKELGTYANSVGSVRDWHGLCKAKKSNRGSYGSNKQLAKESQQIDWKKQEWVI